MQHTEKSPKKGESRCEIEAAFKETEAATNEMMALQPSEISLLEGIKYQGKVAILDTAQVLTEKLPYLFKHESKTTRQSIASLLVALLEMGKTAH